MSCGQARNLATRFKIGRSTRPSVYYRSEALKESHDGLGGFKNCTQWATIQDFVAPNVLAQPEMER
jgi:hypothetical protein